MNGPKKAERPSASSRPTCESACLQPLARGFTDDFAEGVRSRDPGPLEHRPEVEPVPWFVVGADAGAAAGCSRRLTRLLLNLEPVVELAARQAEINEYHRRLLWEVTSRDLEVARLELDLVKRELRRLGVNAEFSFGAGVGRRRDTPADRRPLGGQG